MTMRAIAIKITIKIVTIIAATAPAESDVVDVLVGSLLGIMRTSRVGRCNTMS